jgi:probable F420-dependent oxidoreductase
MVVIGALFPQTELGSDPIAVRDFAQAAEDLGFHHILTYEHVLGAQTDRPDRQGRRWAYSIHDSFLEPFALFSYIAAITQRIGMTTGILIAPQRQTVLIAKQAATVDVLSGGRLRLGIGLGWNEVEYEALGQDFHNRGKRMEEQVAVLRALWTQEQVRFEGRWHHIDDAGLKPLPVQRPIPIWMGGSADAALRRIARLADGWVLAGRPTEETAAGVRRLHAYIQEAGRDPSAVGLQGGIVIRDGTTPDDWRSDYDTWTELGATHVHVNTGGAGFTSPSAHIDALRRVKELLS